MSAFVSPSSRPVANRVHQCDYCGDDIPAKQRYKRWASIQNRTVHTVKAHIACDDVAQDYWQETGADPDERWVTSEPLTEWSRGQDNPAGRLAALGAAWSPEEMERVSRIVLGDAAQPTLK